MVAYHEIGHALVAAKQTNSAPVQKITIVPRTSGALGYTMQVDEGNHYLMTKEELETKIATYTGGRAAEEIIFQSISTGASNDIEKATKTARSMVTKYGMTKELGCICYGTDNSAVFLGRDMGRTQDYSEATAAKIDELVLQIVNDAYDRAEKILSENIDKLHEIAAYLIKHEKMGSEDFEAVMNGTYVEPIEVEESDESEETVSDNANSETKNNNSTEE